MNDQYRRRRVKYAELEETSMNDNKKHSDRRVKKTKKAIQDALMTLMDKKNISDITIIELTKEADVNRKTSIITIPISTRLWTKSKIT